MKYFLHSLEDSFGCTMIWNGDFCPVTVLNKNLKAQICNKKWVFWIFWQKIPNFFFIIPRHSPSPIELIHTLKTIFMALKMVQNGLIMAPEKPKNALKMPFVLSFHKQQSQNLVYNFFPQNLPKKIFFYQLNFGMSSFIWQQV